MVDRLLPLRTGADRYSSFHARVYIPLNAEHMIALLLLMMVLSSSSLGCLGDSKSDTRSQNLGTAPPIYSPQTDAVSGGVRNELTESNRLPGQPAAAPHVGTQAGGSLTEPSDQNSESREMQATTNESERFEDDGLERGSRTAQSAGIAMDLAPGGYPGDRGDLNTGLQGGVDGTRADTNNHNETAQAGAQSQGCGSDDLRPSMAEWGPCEIEEHDRCQASGQRTRRIEVCEASNWVTRTEIEACTIDRTQCVDGIPTRFLSGLPQIHDFSDAEPSRVDSLIRQAMDGLGLDGLRGPQEQDRIFVGRWYIAWIDQTGFYGKMNGLWSLNGDPDNLAFVLLDGSRPVSVLAVGENGRGTWPAGYMGAEHIEYPNDVPEDDDYECTGGGRFCAQYSLGEAPHYRDPDIPSWRACNEGSPGWQAHFQPIEIGIDNGALRLLYEGRLTKQGDFGGSSTGANCHEDYLFSDGVRRPVYLRTGYRLDAQTHHVDRLLQVRNPTGNPVVDGPYGFIGGFVITQWPNPHPLKAVNRYLRVEQSAVSLDWGYPLNIPHSRWVPLPGTVPAKDVVLGWARQAVTLSPLPEYARGRALTLSQHGEGENGDSGMCLCIVHGAIEMGGGMISEGVAGGQISPMGIRRLTLHHEVDSPIGFERIYEAETALNGQGTFGRLEEDAWSANTRDDEPGHLAYGPYATDWPGTTLVADFRLLIDVRDDRTEVVATIEVYDQSLDEIVSQQDIRRADFRVANRYQNFTLSFDMAERAGHSMETRVYWHDISALRIDRVTVRMP